MRIGFDARLAWRRGVGTYAANLLLALSRVDHYNEYVVLGAPAELKRVISNRRFKFIGPETEHSSRWVRALMRQPAVYEQFWLPSVLVNLELDLLHYVDNSATISAQVPYVVTVHDTMFLRPFSEAYPKGTFKQHLVDFYKKRVVPTCARNALSVITVSNFSKDCIVKGLAVPEDHVFVTLEGVDPELFSPRAPKKKNTKEGLPIVLVHGADDERKNLMNILKGVSSLMKKGKQVRVEILGMDERVAERTGYTRRVADWGLADRVKWCGNVSPARVREAYHRADLFLYASRWEGFGLPVLEAFASGVPVITSKTTSLPEVAGEAAILVDPEDPEAIAMAVDQILSDKKLRARLVKMGLERAKEFSWDRTARQTIDVYRQAVLEMEYDRQGRRYGIREEG